MTEQRKDTRPPYRPRNNNAIAQSRRIEWARSLTNAQMESLLQDALLRSRAEQPRNHQVILTEEVVHELKSRLQRYDSTTGPPPPPKKRRYDESDKKYDDEDDEEYDDEDDDDED